MREIGRSPEDDRGSLDESTHTPDVANVERRCEMRLRITQAMAFVVLTITFMQASGFVAVAGGRFP